MPLGGFPLLNIVYIGGTRRHCEHTSHNTSHNNRGARPLCRRWNRGNCFLFQTCGPAPRRPAGVCVLYLCCEERRAALRGLADARYCDFQNSRRSSNAAARARGTPARPRPAQWSADTRASRFSRGETLGGNARRTRARRTIWAAAELRPQVQLGQRLPDGRIHSVSHVLREQRHDVPRLLRALDAQDV